MRVIEILYDASMVDGGVLTEDCAAANLTLFLTLFVLRCVSLDDA